MRSATSKLLTLLLAWAAADIFRRLHIPVPWMLGPLLATALATLAGLPTRSSLRLRNGGQWVMGASLGLYFTPAIVAQLGALWWAVLAAVAWSLALGMVYGYWLYRSCAGRLHGVHDAALRPSAYFAGAIGAASEMTLLAEKEGARTDLVAASHSLRMLIVVLVMPFGMLLAKSWWNLEVVSLAPLASAPFTLTGAAWLALLTVAGGLALHVLRLPNPWFLGPLLVAITLAATETAPVAVPTLLSNAAQLVIGVSLGVRFSPQFLHTAPRWLARVALGTAGLIAACAAFGVLLAWATGLHPATAILGTAPGGMTEMSITAKALQLGVPVVTALQVTRLVAVLVLVRPAYWLWATRLHAGMHSRQS
ncbi:MAG: AbrB family transcriptional regulator [Acidovorax soli]|uniref:AbrB family transcriptional regulator n=1 Tax=Acidovorax soli TaxID=592050 RepID=UPI0026F2B751|nr:AbrB family transcriptional regulator [Acidovorax soli]MCM2345148.1 AbrB family transcriptional regulator [Acidovorax soli]